MKIDFSGFYNKVVGSLKNAGKTIFNKKRAQLINAIKPVVFDAIYDCPEMESIRSGKLRADFGLNFDPTKEIALAVSESVDLYYAFPLNAIFNFRLNVQPISNDNLLSLPSSIVITEDGAEIPWLEWLLTYGDKAIIADFGVFYKDGVGRSEQAIMVKNIGPFTVDPRYSGVSGNNFITRALNSKSTEIQRVAWLNLLN